MHASKRIRLLTLGLMAAAASTLNCAGCSFDEIGLRTVRVNFTIDGQPASEACARMGAQKVAARARWTTSDNTVEVRQGTAECSSGTVSVGMGGSGTVQVIAYETTVPDLNSSDTSTVAMGVSAPTPVELAGPAVEETTVNVDVVPLRGTLNIHIGCGVEGGSCEGEVQTTGEQALRVDVLLDTNGADLEVVDQLTTEGDGRLEVESDGHIKGVTHRARVDAVNVVRATGYAPDGTLLRAEDTIRLTTLEASIELKLVPAIVTHDAGYMPVDGGTSSSSSGGASSSGVVVTSSSAAASSSEMGTSSSAATASSSVATMSSSAATESSSAAAMSSSAATQSSSAAAMSSSAATMSSSAAAQSSSAMGMSSSAATQSSSAAASSAMGTSSSAAGSSSEMGNSSSN